MKKKITFFALLLLLTSCSIEFVWPSNKTSNKGEDSSLPVSISNSNNTSGLPSYISSSNTEPINYDDIDIMLNKANKEDNLNLTQDGCIISGTTTYTTRGVVTRIDVGADGKDNIYIENTSSSNVYAGLFIYGATYDENLIIGKTIEIKGTITNYKGCVEMIPTEVKTIEELGMKSIEPQNISVSNLLASNYLDQGKRVVLKNVSFSDVNEDYSGHYINAIVDGIEVGIKVDARNENNTLEVANYIYGLVNTNKIFDISGNITYSNGAYKLSISKIGDLVENINQGHVHSYNSFMQYDDENHYEICECGDKRLANHIASDWIVDKEATSTDYGEKHTECTKCYKVLERRAIPLITLLDDVTLDLYAFNDTHGAVKDSDSASGIEKTATAIKNIQSQNKNTIVLSSGDMWQGSMYSNKTKGNLMTEWMNELNFVSMTLGNHEFDWGQDTIRQNLELADFPFLGINVYDTDTNQRVDYCDASTVVVRGGIKIGVVGAIGDCQSSISGSKITNVTFKTGNELANLVIDEARKLKEEENCQVVVYSLHDNTAGYQDSISQSGYVDVVFEGHSHTQYATKDNYGIYHVQSSAYGAQISHVTLTYDISSKTTKVETANSISTLTFSSYQSDSNVQNLLNKYASVIGNPNEIVGRTSSNKNSATILQTIADCMLDLGVNEWGNSYDIVLAGGYLSIRYPYNLSSGNVTMEQIYNLLPFDNDIVLCSATGKFLKNYYINSTNKNYYISYNSGYSSSTSLNNNSIYYFITDTYGSDYYIYGKGYNSTNKFQEVLHSISNKYARDLLADFIRNGGYQ